MTDAETSQRNFLLTGSDEHLQLLNQALPQVSQALATLRTLTKDKPRLQQRLDRLGVPGSRQVEESPGN